MTFTLDDLDGVDLSLPSVSLPRCNPNYEIARPSFDAWMYYIQELAPDMRRRIRNVDHLWAASFWYPNGSAQGLLDAAKQATLIITRDDMVDMEGYRRVPEIVPAALEDCRSRHTTVAEPFFGPLFEVLWADLSRYSSPAVMQRLMEDEEELLTAYIESNEIQTRGGFTSLEEFFRVHGITFATRMWFTCAEVANGSDYSGLIDHPAAQALLQCNRERFLLYDGLSSLRVDIAQQNLQDNIIALLARLDGISLKESVDKVRLMWDENRVRHRELSIRLLLSPLGGHPHATELINVMEDTLVGSIAVYAHSPRYDPDSSKDGN
ncbi:terpene synthase family protein [Nocardia sp. NPDC003345]